MRVTQGMIINNNLNGLYSNMNGINKVFAQLSTGKKIQTVSDDPIIAGRALKLRTTVLENGQYQKNVKEANSWMEITEGALDNMEEILKDISTKCAQGANGTLDEEDKNSIKTDIAQLMDEFLKEANVTYSGRYVFSGYKTDEPMILTKEMILDNILNIEKDMTVPTGTTAAQGSIIKDGSSFGESTQLGKGTNIPGGSVLKAGTTISKDDAMGLLGFNLSGTSYTLDSDYTIKEGTTLSKQAAEDLGLVTPGTLGDGETFKVTTPGGHVIPKGTSVTKTVGEEVVGVNVSADEYTITEDITLTGDFTLQGELKLGAGSTINGDITLMGNSVLGGGTVIKENSELASGSKLPEGAFNPLVYGKIDGQGIAYEVGTNNTIEVNVTGMDKILAEFMGSMEEIITMIDGSQGDNPKYTVEELSKMYDKKVGEISDIAAKISEKRSDLGSRMKRVEYVDKRLVGQNTTFTGLLSETEDVDIEKAYVEFNTRYATYQSALQATSKVIMNTLADYL